MKYEFTGEGEITIRRMTFPAGKPVKVECELLAAKLDGLDYFRKVKTRKVKANG